MRINTLARSLIVLLFLLDDFGVQSASASAPEPRQESEQQEAWEAVPASTYSEMSVELSTPTHQVIEFNANESVETPAAEIEEIPHLVLKRNGVLTPGYERTLEITANNVPVYAPGSYVKLVVNTQHIDSDHEGQRGKKIQVWHEERFVPYTISTQQGVRIHFSTTFNNYTNLGEQTTPTPTDYFQYQISIVDMNENLRQSYTKNYAFLMESQWRVPLPELLEAMPGSAPDNLLIYYYDMVPYQADLRDPISQIPRQSIERYIQVELIPAMAQAIKTQSNEWGFAWYPEWHNFRADEDPKTLSVALGEYGVWFHGEAPSLGHAMISIRVDGTAREYVNLKDGIMSTFHHELFHNIQRSISLHFNGNGNIAGRDEAWKMFTEGTAVLASSVGQPDVQFGMANSLRSYMRRANAYIGADGVFNGGLNKSYEKIPYNTTLYWRFLYEKCGGMENTATGMSVIRTVLGILYNGEVVNIHNSANFTEALPKIMDHALGQSASCPFHNYEQSLSEFAHSIYMLRLANGRCPNLTKSGCGFYDPNSLYTIPSVETVSVATRPATYANGNIPVSYGIDFIEIKLDSTVSGKMLKVEFDRS